MNCSQVDQYLDEMLDGTLGAEELETLEAHCRGCAACAEKLKANRLMMDLFSETAPEMDVPLGAQAAWRGAVRREAQAAKRKRFLRYAGGIAAALVVALGATFALRAPDKNSVEMMRSAETVEEFAVSDDALIEADGAAEAAQFNSLFEASGALMPTTMPDMDAGAPMHEIVIRVEDVDRVCDYAQDLAAEYEGTIEIQHFDEDGAPCANLYLDLPGANAAEFIEAMRHFDQSGAQLEAMDFEGETSILLVLKSK